MNTPHNKNRTPEKSSVGVWRAAVAQTHIEMTALGGRAGQSVGMQAVLGQHLRPNFTHTLTPTGQPRWATLHQLARA